MELRFSKKRLRQRLLHKYNNLSLQNMDASQAFFEILQAARRNNLLGVWPIVKIIRADNSIRFPHKFLGFESYSGT
ncbi:hypothetical protein [Chamaesiphon sp. OTE_20_metabat_361]|nr:hypothetical protein [Chamaesiphon sp. OTE_20_metabat_361]